ncbi:conserved hypothetical protein [Staphylococcus aureus A9754]|nr:conserved hypothetical protein [Staphylococcus aureus A9754]
MKVVDSANVQIVIFLHSCLIISNPPFQYYPSL